MSGVAGAADVSWERKTSMRRSADAAVSVAVAVGGAVRGSIVRSELQRAGNLICNRPLDSSGALRH